MILINSYFENERELWGEHIFCEDLCRDEDIKRNGFAPIVARGSIAFDNSVKFTLKTLGLPDLRFPFNNDPKYYNYSYWRSLPDLLNEDYFDGYEWEDVLDSFQHHEKLWIRSASGNKNFTGGVFTRGEFMNEVEYLKQINSDDIVFVVAYPKTIYREYRFVFVGGKVISSSLYMENGNPKQGEHASDDLTKFAQKWFDSQCLLPKHVVVDITDDQKIIEINNIFTSGWYSCDLERIITAVKKELDKFKH
jgi:hypothetical protein